MDGDLMEAASWGPAFNQLFVSCVRQHFLRSFAAGKEAIAGIPGEGHLALGKCHNSISIVIDLAATLLSYSGCHGCPATPHTQDGFFFYDPGQSAIQRGIW